MPFICEVVRDFLAVADDRKRLVSPGVLLTGTAGFTENGQVNDNLAVSVPPVEYSPPYTMNFVAHLSGGCYPADITPALLSAVRADETGARMLDGITMVELELRLCGSQ